AEPDLEDNARLPCLATGTPAPATTSDAPVEMLSVPAPSPPVPTMSMALSGASTGTILRRMIETAAAISPTVSPLTRMPIRNAPIWEGVASPDMMVSITSRISVPVRSLPCAIRLRAELMSMPGCSSDGFVAIGILRDVQEVLQDGVAVCRSDAFGVELHAMHWQLAVLDAHDLPVLGPGR